MSLRFVFGPSGAGKSRFLYEDVIRRAEEAPKQNFFIIVPDQFTMQTQKELVLLSKDGGIMNIDVLSFGRLNHRIMEEVGGDEIPVLDDTGKSLVLQKVAGELKDQLKVLGGFLHRQGYIHEVKSVISEFMQYGIGREDVDGLIEAAGKRGALAGKLEDLKILYAGFCDYIDKKFITTEGTLEVLCRSLEMSDLIRDSVVIFDGFTGFTPIQNRVIEKLMGLCSEVVVTLTLGEGEEPFLEEGEQKLFYLSKKTAITLDHLAGRRNVPRGKDIFVRPGKDAPEKIPPLAHLEKYLFRYKTLPFEGENDAINIFKATQPRDEVHQTGIKICELVRERKLAYRDIAVVTGDLEGYAPYVETEFAQMGIPVFLDRTRGIVLNPMTEFIKSALELYRKDFSYEAVFHFLRSGMADLEPEEVDLLEEYCIATGMRGYKSYNRLFTKKTKRMEEDEERLGRLNEIRERFLNQVEMLHMEEKETVKSYVDKLYEFLTVNQVQQKLENFRMQFEEEGEPAKAREYAQIFRLVMDLLNQIYELLGEEEITLGEFADILEAGFGEIQVGTIPQNVDRVVVGDVERSRLKEIKVLFFLGINDGNIPKGTSKGGILSDLDREFLLESGTELAPGPRQQMFIQRLYLYLNMTKPTEKLYLSYSNMKSDGKAVRPAYLIDTVKKLFPGLTVEFPEAESPLNRVVTATEGEAYLAEGLREYASGALSKEQERELFTLYEAYGSSENYQEKRECLREAAFRRYREETISKAVALALYGKHLENSVSRLETFAQCAYRHFLQYGLTLKEREEFSFETVDMGNVYHTVLEEFAKGLEESGYTWFDFPEEYARNRVADLMESCAATYGSTVLYSSARAMYSIKRMARVLVRTVLTLQKQLKKGSFQPEGYEMSFRFAEDLESVNIHLSEEEKMHLQGRIDRVDVASEGDNLYVKVIDYKSGKKHFDLAALYYGLQLQLVVYMNAATEMEARKHPDKHVIPAAMLYYHMEDPMVETDGELSDEELDNEILKQLKMKGIVSSEPGIVERLDGEMVTKSDIIPVEIKKDGTFTARSSVLDGEQLKTVSEYVNRKIRSIGREILDGNVALRPYELGQDKACTYCPYKKACGFEEGTLGCASRKLQDLSDEEALAKMKETD